MPDYLTFENWPVSLRLREAEKRSNKIKDSAASSTSLDDTTTRFKLRIVSIIDILLRELEEM